MLKVGVVGLGQIGSIHLDTLLHSDLYEVVGYFDLYPKSSHQVDTFNIKRFELLEDLIHAVDVVDIVSPLETHFEIAAMAIKNQKHVFIDKPVCQTEEEAKKLIALSHEAKVKVQVGHVERFNPAFSQVKHIFDNPLYIESLRHTEYNAEVTSTSVIHDLMIHDIDIILNIVKSNVKKISATGVAVVNGTPDIANARIEFDNGAVANLTASRIAMQTIRKIRVFQKNAFISVDFLNEKAQYFETDADSGVSPKNLNLKTQEIQTTNPIKDELDAFAKAIIENQTPEVTLNDGFDAISIANKIIEKLKLTNELVE